MQTLLVKECLLFGWNTFKKRPWFFVGTFVAYMLLQIFLSMVQENHGHPSLPGFLLSTVASTLFAIGLIQVYLKAHTDVQAPQFSDLWKPEPFLSYIATSFLVLLIVGAGLVLLIIPGIILALALSFSAYLVVDRGLNPIEALKESARLTKGHRGKLCLLGLSLLGLAILGAIPLFLGLFIVGPVSMLAGIHAYRTLEKTVATPTVSESEIKSA